MITDMSPEQQARISEDSLTRVQLKSQDDQAILEMFQRKDVVEVNNLLGLFSELCQDPDFLKIVSTKQQTVRKQFRIFKEEGVSVFVPWHETDSIRFAWFSSLTEKDITDINSDPKKHRAIVWFPEMSLEDFSLLLRKAYDGIQTKAKREAKRK